jgi:hypothetical protein
MISGTRLINLWVVVLCVILIATASTAFALDITNYMPHAAGNQWSYINNKNATMTQTMGSSVTMANGLVAIPWTSVDSSLSGQTTGYTTIDENGWRKHQEYSSSVYVSGYGYTSATISFSPPLSVMPANVNVGSTYSSNVTCETSITNVITVNLNCTSSALVVGFETVSNHDGSQSWSALKVILSMTVSGTINGQFTSQTSDTSIWAVEGLGTVKMYRQNNVSMEMETWTLTSTNVTAEDPITTVNSPILTTITSGLDVTASWTSVSGATGYTLYYAPYPYLGEHTIASSDMGTATDFSVTLWDGASYYVAITASDGSVFGESEYSNIDLFTIDTQ